MMHLPRKRLLRPVLALLALAVLSGCVVYPDEGYHHHHYHGPYYGGGYGPGWRGGW
ncbi:MAG: hypothetical protein ACJ8AW_27415 [Rhodopila sp.]